MRTINPGRMQWIALMCFVLLLVPAFNGPAKTSYYIMGFLYSYSLIRYLYFKKSIVPLRL
nr:hypothetical protein Q903MT_gene4594 [Picea sitchensis]